MISDVDGDDDRISNVDGYDGIYQRAQYSRGTMDGSDSSESGEDSIEDISEGCLEDLLEVTFTDVEKITPIESCVDLTQCGMLESERTFCHDVAFRALSDEKIDDITGFTGREKKIIWKSWKKMNYHRAGTPFATSFVMWLLQNVPQMPAFFDKFNARQSEGALAGDRMLLAHAQVLVGELYRIITLLPNQSSYNVSSLESETEGRSGLFWSYP